MKRKVKILLVNKVWLVCYTERRKHQRYLAAQFDANSYYADYVRDWVLRNPKLELVFNM